MKKIIILLSIALNAIVAEGQIKKDTIPDLIANKETAIKIAEVIWQSLYGNETDNYKPYKVKLVNNKKWIVQGSVSKSFIGGYPYIEINKKDCKILKVIHTK